MIDTNFNAVFDVSAIIWDEDDFKADKSKYYKLRNGVSYLFEKIISLNDCSLILPM